MVQPSSNKRPLITAINPKSPVSEAYRVLRTNIEFSAVDEELKIIMVTSAGPGEGKSTTAANLAVVMAQSDKKVLIIDADLRKPTMHYTFYKSNLWGLTSLLTGQTSIEDVILETDITNLDLLPAGHTPPNPSEILSSKRMSAILIELRQKYDVIVLDTPPALAVTDAQIMASKCDGVIIVIDAGNVKRDISMKVKANLEHVKARILGVVLNNIEHKNNEIYYHYYGEKSND